MWWHTTDTVFDMFKLSILPFIFTLNLKSEFSKVFALIPYPSDPKSNTFFPFQLFVVKSFVALTSNALIQKSLDFVLYLWIMAEQNSWPEYTSQNQ